MTAKIHDEHSGVKWRKRAGCSIFAILGLRNRRNEGGKGVQAGIRTFARLFGRGSSLECAVEKRVKEE